MRLDVYFHLPTDPSLREQLDRMESTLATILSTQGAIMATTAEIRQLVTDVATAIQPLGPAIDNLEAQITALTTSGALTPQQQADLDDAFLQLTGIRDAISAAVTDAADGVDEGVPPV